MAQKFTGNSKGEVAEQLQKALEIKQATLYKRLEFLKVNIQKHSSCSWIDEEDFDELVALGEWIDTHGKMEGFERRADKQAIVKTEETTLDIPAEQPTVQAENNPRNFGSEQQQMSQLVASAQNKATGVLIAEGILAQQFITNPEMLPEQLRTQIQEANAIPQVDPNAFAAELLRQNRTAA